MRHLLWFCGTALIACGGSDISIDGGGGDGNVGTDSSGMDGNVGMDGGGDGSMCPMSQTSCNGVCVDLTTSPGNCGGCGVNCTGGSCKAGVCSLLNPDAGAPPNVADFACIAIDATNVYVATGLPANNGGQIYKVPVNGGSPTPVATMQANPHGIKSNGQYVFWANFGNNTIMRSDPNGGNVTPIVMNQMQPLNITIDTTYIFWINAGDGSVWRADLPGGGNATKIFNGYGANHVGFMANAGANVFFTITQNNIVASTPKAGGNTTQPATGQMAPRGIDSDGTSLFWGNGTGNTIMKQAIVNPQTPTTIAMSQANPAGVATDGTNVYWANQAMGMNNGSIAKVSMGGGNVTTLATAQNFPNCVAVDNTSVYWINEGGGMINKTGK